MQPYACAEWKIAGVNIDYHIEANSHYNSVPHQLIGKKIDVRITENTIECFYNIKPVAALLRFEWPASAGTGCRLPPV